VKDLKLCEGAQLQLCHKTNKNQLRALQAAEKLARAVGRGFIPGLKSIKSTWALQAAEKPLIPVSSSLFEGVFGLLGVNSIVVFVSVGRFFGLQTHFGPIGPAIQSESASSCALGFAP